MASSDDLYLKAAARSGDRNDPPTLSGAAVRDMTLLQLSIIPHMGLNPARSSTVLQCNQPHLIKSRSMATREQLTRDSALRGRAQPVCDIHASMLRGIIDVINGLRKIVG
jgi:hypothetical protein